MVGITERNKQKIQLANAGFTLKYIDEWQAKTTLYRHKPSYNNEGQIIGAVGTAVTGVPGNPDYVLRKAKIGLFPWKPGPECDCTWCRETDWKAQEPQTVKGFCDTCGFEAEAKNSSGIGAKLAFHKKSAHPDV
tara:strand:+ start:136 stop:537 length:402 start_codon:yes stop_codon:yes gene_type:complete